MPEILGSSYRPASPAVKRMGPAAPARYAPPMGGDGRRSGPGPDDDPACRSIDRRLARARKEASERAALVARRAKIATQIADAASALQDCERTLEREDADVRRLEGRSVAALVAAVFGKKEARLREERAEALHALLARDAVRARLDALRADLAAIDARLAESDGAAAELEAALRSKEEYLVLHDDPVLRRLTEIDALAADARSVLAETAEAIDAADQAAHALDRVAARLDSARQWGTFDLLGGGMFATWAKHSEIDEARREAHGAQSALDRLGRELADVGPEESRTAIVVDLDEFARFADLFLDGLIFDWMVQERITKARESVAAVSDRVRSVRGRLAKNRREIGRELAALAERRAAEIESA